MLFYWCFQRLSISVVFRRAGVIWIISSLLVFGRPDIFKYMTHVPNIYKKQSSWSIDQSCVFVSSVKVINHCFPIIISIVKIWFITIIISLFRMLARCSRSRRGGQFYLVNFTSNLSIPFFTYYFLQWIPYILTYKMHSRITCTRFLDH